MMRERAHDGPLHLSLSDNRRAAKTIRSSEQLPATCSSEAWFLVTTTCASRYLESLLA